MSDIVERLSKDDSSGMSQHEWEARIVLHKLLQDAVSEITQLREALQWFVDNDDTNEGDTPLPEHGGRTWNEINSYWIDGRNRARDLLKGGGDD